MAKATEIILLIEILKKINILKSCCLRLSNESRELKSVCMPSITQDSINTLSMDHRLCNK